MGKMKELFMENRENDKRNYPMTPDESYQSKDCPICDGAGSFGYSTCCGTSVINGLCALCHQPTEPEPCNVCNGTGKVPMDEDDIQDQKENEIIGNDEMMKDPV